LAFSAIGRQDSGVRSKRSLLGIVVLAGLTGGCIAVEPLPPAVPELPLESWEYEPADAARADTVKEAPVPGPSGVKEREALAKTAMTNPRRQPTTTAPSSVPGGEDCLSELSASGTRFSKSAPVLGIATPVVVQGPLGGIPYYTLEKKPMVADCRLALALVRIGPDLEALGVTRVRFSSTYVYRTSHPGRMSMHAYGLAIDVHAVEVGGSMLDVKKAFERGRGTTCSDGMAPLNLMACRLRNRGLFKELIGPDDNAAHRDHFHLGLKPLAGEVAADLPWPKVTRRARSTRARSAR
jgi:hypothetical protein